MRSFILNILKGTVLSILVFFSLSFITVLFVISPLHLYEEEGPYRLEIGVPFKYYEQFWLRGNDFPNSGWMPDQLIYDCIITWVIVTAFYFIRLKLKLNASDKSKLVDK